MSLHIVTNLGHPREDSLFVMDGTLTSTLLVIFLLHHDKILTEIESFPLYMHAVENPFISINVL